MLGKDALTALLSKLTSASSMSSQLSLGTSVDELFEFLSDSDENTTNPSYQCAKSPTPGLIHVFHQDNISSPEAAAKTKQKTSNLRLDQLVSSLFEMKKYIKNQQKVMEYEKLIDLLLLKFNDMQAEKFNLLQQLHNLEKENDKLYDTQQSNKENETFEEIKDIDLNFMKMDPDKSVILVDYWKDCKQHNNAVNAYKQQKSPIAPWTKYYSRHKIGIGEDLRIALISSQKLQDTATYTDDQYFNETLQGIELKCYFPKIFHSLRHIFGITLSEFLSSFKVNNLLEINASQSSLSGSQFFYSFDGKYVIKTMRKEEVTFVKQMIGKYAEYMTRNRNNSFINRFYAMFKIINKIQSKTANHFVIMNCIYYDNNAEDVPLSVYDIKGSQYNRITEKQRSCEWFKSNNKSMRILKDHEWMERERKLDVDTGEAQRIKEQLYADIQFLKQMEIMDYSLLIAVYEVNKKKKYFIGIIDFLQHFTFWKQVEGNGAYYILGIDGYDIVDPEQYANRLWKFVCKFVV